MSNETIIDLSEMSKRERIEYGDTLYEKIRSGIIEEMQEFGYKPVYPPGQWDESSTKGGRVCGPMPINFNKENEPYISLENSDVYWKMVRGDVEFMQSLLEDNGFRLSYFLRELLGERNQVNIENAHDSGSALEAVA